MKIVLINTVYGIMSTGRTYRELHDYYVDCGHQCKVFYGEKKTNLPDAVFMGGLVSHKIHALCSRVTGKTGCYSINATRRLIRFLEKYQPDIVHLGNLHGNFINIPMLLRFLSDMDYATVVTLHDCFFYTGGCTHYTLNKCYKWKEACGKCEYFRKQGSWFFDRTKELFNLKEQCFQEIPRLGVVGVSEWITNEAKCSPVFSNAKRIQKIFNWIDISKFRPVESRIKEELEITDKYLILGVASGWSDAKGLSDFIQLAGHLGPEYHIVLVGRMPVNLIFPDNMHSVPETESVDELVQYYAGSDVFVQLSKEETFGKVVAEALACGTPAVVYDSTASPELVTGGCGAVVSPQDGIEGIRLAISQVTALGKQCYQEQCRSRAELLFSKNNNCEKMLSLYEMIQ